MPVRARAERLVKRPASRGSAWNVRSTSGAAANTALPGCEARIVIAYLRREGCDVGRADIRRVRDDQVKWAGQPLPVVTDYKVRVVNSEAGTGAKVRVFIEFQDANKTWTTVGVNKNIVEASWKALVEAIEYKLLKG